MQIMRIESKQGYSRELLDAPVSTPALRIYQTFCRRVVLQIQTPRPHSNVGSMLSGMPLNADEARRVIAQLELFLTTQADR